MSEQGKQEPRPITCAIYSGHAYCTCGEHKEPSYEELIGQPVPAALRAQGVSMTFEQAVVYQDEQRKPLEQRLREAQLEITQQGLDATLGGLSLEERIERKVAAQGEAVCGKRNTCHAIPSGLPIPLCGDPDCRHYPSQHLRGGPCIVENNQFIEGNHCKCVGWLVSSEPESGERKPRQYTLCHICAATGEVTCPHLSRPLAPAPAQPSEREKVLEVLLRECFQRLNPYGDAREKKLMDKVKVALKGESQ